MTKRIPLKAWLSIAGLVLLAGFLVYMTQNAPAENKERLLRLFQEMPAPIFYSIFGIGGVLPMVLLFWILISQKRWSQMARRASVHEAKKVALNLWQVENPGAMQDWMVVGFRHPSWTRLSFILPVRPGHPDIEQFRRLKDGDTVEFEPLSEGMECAFEHELCGFLRIKAVS